MCTGTILGHGQIYDKMPTGTRCITNKQSQGYSSRPKPPLNTSMPITNHVDGTGGRADVVYYSGPASNRNDPYVIRMKAQVRCNLCSVPVRNSFHGGGLAPLHYDYDASKGIGGWASYLTHLPASVLPNYQGMDEDEGARSTAYFAANPGYDIDDYMEDMVAGRCPPW